MVSAAPCACGLKIPYPTVDRQSHSAHTSPSVCLSTSGHPRAASSAPSSTSFTHWTDTKTIYFFLQKQQGAVCLGVAALWHHFLTNIDPISAGIDLTPIPILITCIWPRTLFSDPSYYHWHLGRLFSFLLLLLALGVLRHALLSWSKSHANVTLFFSFPCRFFRAS